VTAPDLTIPSSIFTSLPALWQDAFYILRPQSATVGGITTPSDALRLGPYDGEFWEVGGDELAPAIAEARGRYRLACALGTDVRETDQIEVAGIAYEVRWAPPASGLDLQRVVGLTDAAVALTGVAAGYIFDFADSDTDIGPLL